MAKEKISAKELLKTFGNQPDVLADLAKEKIKSLTVKPSLAFVEHLSETEKKIELEIVKNKLNIHRVNTFIYLPLIKKSLEAGKPFYLENPEKLGLPYLLNPYFVNPLIDTIAKTKEIDPSYFFRVIWGFDFIYPSFPISTKFTNGTPFSTFLLLELQTVISLAVKELINTNVDFLKMYLDYFNGSENLSILVGKITDKNLGLSYFEASYSNNNIFDFLVRFVESFYIL